MIHGRDPLPPSPKELERDGAEGRQLSAISYGATRPINDVDDPSARAADRRIEIDIMRENE